MTLETLRARFAARKSRTADALLEIVEKCPTLYWNVIEYNRESDELPDPCRWDICSCGLRCDVGWAPIIEKASIMIDFLVQRIPEEHRKKYYPKQIKEKWWGLRFYMGKYYPTEGEEKFYDIESINRDIDAIIRAAEIEAMFTCEQCSKFGTNVVVSKGRCQECIDKDEYGE